jgi:glycerophosphoryl diester phosphodiesterase
VSVVAVAHRGEPVGHRENTLPPFAAAVDQRADMVEIDLRRTRDGEIVVLHDQTLERLWGVGASVGDWTWPTSPPSASDVRIPTLRAVLEAVPLR